MKQQSNEGKTSVEPAVERDSSTLLKAKPVEPVRSVEPGSFYRGVYPPANYHTDIGLRQRDGDGAWVRGRIDIQSGIFDVRSR